MKERLPPAQEHTIRKSGALSHGPEPGDECAGYLRRRRRHGEQSRGASNTNSL